MKPDIFVDNFGRADEQDACYSILGRALALATRFESNCRALATQLAIRETPEILAEPIEQQAKLVAVISEGRLAQHIRSVGKSFVELPGFDIEKLLHEGREARNSLAHDAAADVIDTFRNEEGRDEFSEWLEPLVRKIALADRIVCVSLSLLNRDPLPNADFLARYENALARWVLDKGTR